MTMTTTIVEVKVPQLSESVAEATLLQWKKKAGQAVAADEILIDVETDKVVLEIPAPAAGVLVEILAGDGATVASDQAIARIDTAAVVGAGASAEAPAQQAAAPVAASASTAATASGAAAVMPAAAKLLADHHLSASAVAGSGKDGRITKSDVLAAVASGVGNTSSAASAVAQPASTAAIIPTGVPTAVLPQAAAPTPN